MQITWNGVGSAWANQNGNSSALVEDAGFRLLIDCGHTVPGRLRQMGVQVQDLNAIFISHLHGDHIYGLEEIGFRTHFMENNKPTLIVPENLAHTLWKHILSGTMRQVGGHCTLEDYFDVRLIKEGCPLQIEGLTLEIHTVNHIPNIDCFGVRVANANKTAAFTADTKAFVPDFFYKHTDLVFHDCSFQPYHKETVHAHYEEIISYSEAHRQKTFLVHYDDDTERLLQIETWRTALEKSQMRLARPFQTITL